jgi:hypothetical protein
MAHLVNKRLIKDATVVELTVEGGVYRSVNGMVHHNCDFCRKIHLLPDNITPRVWLSSEVETGYHIKNSDRPCWSGLHPNERCALTSLLPGFGFSKDGRVTWIGQGHNELEYQRNYKRPPKGEENRLKRIGKSEEMLLETLRKAAPSGVKRASQSEVHDRHLGELFGIDVWSVHGEIIRNTLDTDFCNGGNPERYPRYVHKATIWVEGHTESDVMAVVLHEFVEMGHMKAGDSYEIAHDKATEQEQLFRKAHPSGSPDLEIVREWIESHGLAPSDKLEKALPARTHREFTNDVLLPFGWSQPKPGETGHWGSSHNVSGLNWKGYSQTDISGGLDRQRQHYFLSQLGLASFETGGQHSFGYRPGTEFAEGYRSIGAPSIDEVKQQALQRKVLRTKLGPGAKPMIVLGVNMESADWAPVDQIQHSIPDEELKDPNFLHRASQIKPAALGVVDVGGGLVAENDELLHHARQRGFTHVPVIRG